MNKTQNITINIKAFRAIDDEKACLLFIEGHANVLRDFGVSKVTSSNHEWMKDPDVYVVIVEDTQTGEVYGGERVHIKGNNNIELPIEKAVGVVDMAIYDLIDHYTKRGVTAELCGLWNSKSIAGKGVSILLTKMGVALARLLKVENLFVLCAPYTVKMCQDAGFAIETSIGNQGTFYYPKLDLIATSLVIEDMLYLSHADDKFKAEINEFIHNQQSSFKHVSPQNETIDIHYSLTINIA